MFTIFFKVFQGITNLFYLTFGRYSYTDPFLSTVIVGDEVDNSERPNKQKNDKE
jgi:hypothetical protein